MEDFDLNFKLESIFDGIEREKTARRSQPPALKYGNKFLDEATGGISRKEIVVIAAKSGSGKTAIASSIAQANAEQGRRVHFLALEAEEDEILKRTKYRIAAQKFFEDPERPRISINYRDFYFDTIDDSFDYYEHLAEQEIEKKYRTLFTMYRKSEFTIEDFERYLLAVREGADLIVVDHIHYFDFDNPNENQAYSRIVKKIRDLGILCGIPIILVAHIRKADRREKNILPDMDDLHGTSNIAKIATTVVVMANDDGSDKNETYIKVAKSRIDGSVKKYVAKMIWNFKTNSYEENFGIGVLKNGSDFEGIQNYDDSPQWIKNITKRESKVVFKVPDPRSWYEPKTENIF